MLRFARTAAMPLRPLRNLGDLCAELLGTVARSCAVHVNLAFITPVAGVAVPNSP
jgi:lauroyl/myristoyl acyltransferase